MDVGRTADVGPRGANATHPRRVGEAAQGIGQVRGPGPVVSSTGGPSRLELEDDFRASNQPQLVPGHTLDRSGIPTDALHPGSKLPDLVRQATDLVLSLEPLSPERIEPRQPRPAEHHDRNRHDCQCQHGEGKNTLEQ